MLLWICFYYISGIQQSTIHYLFYKWTFSLLHLLSCLHHFQFSRSHSTPIHFALHCLTPSSLPLPSPSQLRLRGILWGHPLKKAGRISYLPRLKSTVLLYTWKFFPTSTMLIIVHCYPQMLTAREVYHRRPKRSKQCLLMSERLLCSCDGFCGASEQEAGAHVTCRLADGNLERIRRLFLNL